MPTYVYRCKNCQRDIEVIQRFSDEPLKTCEYCGGELQRLLFSPAIIFKGSGWYCKDNPRSTTAGGNGSSLKNRETADKESAVGGNGSSGEAKSKASEPKSTARESKVSVEGGE